MKGYKELAQLNVFSPVDVEKLTGNKKTAYSLLGRLMKKDMVKKIRQNMYSCVDLTTGQTVANRYQIASAVNTSAYVSHHTAFEFYGLANQVFFEVYVSSESKFRDFEFEGVRYKYVASKQKNGVVEPSNTEGVRVTDPERTVIDNIKDYEKIGGLEELLSCLERVNYLNEEKLMQYLDGYGLQVLYQKTGLILERFMRELQLSKQFFDYCKKKIGKSTRYLVKEPSINYHYNSDWKLVIPEGLLEMTKQGGDEFV
jgi:predicted transcriptional regulator of viral defense system